MLASFHSKVAKSRNIALLKLVLIKKMNLVLITNYQIMDDINTEEYRMIFRTVQSNAIKTLIEGLKDIIVDVNFKVNDKGIQVTAIDGKLVTMVHLNLVASGFEFFYCNSPITLGINIKSLYIFLKTVGNNDVITMSVSRDDLTKLNIIIENKEKNMKVKSKLRLLDLNEEGYTIPNIKFDSVIKLPSNDFQKYCKDLSNISDTIIIKNENNQFILAVDGDAGAMEIVLSETIIMELNRISDDDFCGKFDIKYLLLFIKNSNLCTNVEIFLKKNLPLILVYSVASLGSLKFVLAPKTD
jgi:proliferating cell nuclear antigen